METRIMAIFTRTPLHVGAGNSVGAVDSPIMRERHTGFPVIPGSSLKGVFRDHLREMGTDAVNELFGQGGDSDRSSAGKISFGEAKLLAIPVRSAKGSFAIATCPLALNRFARDKGLSISMPDSPNDMNCLAGYKVVIENAGKKGIVLEEYKFSCSGDFPVEWQNILTGILDDEVLKGSKERLVLLSEGDFSHFAVNACQVNQHVKIDDTTGTAEDGKLFNEESVPSETLFYSPVSLIREAKDNPVFKILSEEQLVQFGGKGSTGLGFCTVKII